MVNSPILNYPAPPLLRVLLARTHLEPPLASAASTVVSALSEPKCALSSAMVRSPFKAASATLALNVDE